jgi:HSP20 family molecular chaperone IbpA
MAEEKKEMEVHEQEKVQTEGAERMRSRPTFVPRADIYETDENVLLTVDMPGASEDTIDITLEKDTLTIRANSTHDGPEGYALAFAEFEAGDYERNFRLTDRIDRDNIHAVYTDGVLKLTLPKAEEAKARKISVKTS